MMNRERGMSPVSDINQARVPSRADLVSTGSKRSLVSTNLLSRSKDAAPGRTRQHRTRSRAKRRGMQVRLRLALTRQFMVGYLSAATVDAANGSSRFHFGTASTWGGTCHRRRTGLVTRSLAAGPAGFDDALTPQGGTGRRQAGAAHRWRPISNAGPNETVCKSKKSQR